MGDAGQELTAADRIAAAKAGSTDTKAPELPVPTLGRTVLYTITKEQADEINARRKSSSASRHSWHGNEAREGNVYPMTIVAVWGDTPTCAVNGQLLLDGNDSLWVTSVSVGEGPFHYRWPTRG